ncbi:MAG: IscS subfamily cysteine desulfurase, partial [Legionella sp.]
ELALSTSSACTSASIQPSYVLRAIGLNADDAQSSIRLSIGRFTTEQQVDKAITILCKHISLLREMAP